MNFNEISPNTMSSEQKAKIIKSILMEESIINIKVKSIENEIFLTEEPSIALQKLINFSQLLDKERIAYTEHFVELIEIIGNEAFQNLGIILQHFDNDSYSIQFSAIKQLPQLIELIKKRSTGYEELCNIILPFMKRYLNHQDSDIKQTIEDQMLQLTPFLKETDKVDIILAHFVELAHNEQNSESRITAAKMFGKTSQFFSIKICESFVCGELLSLGIDLNEQVREKAILEIPNIAVALSQKCVELKLIPFLLEKSKEKLQQIKCASAQAIAGLSRYSTHKTKIEYLIPTYLEFLQSPNVEVRKTAYYYLGALISSIRFSQQEQEQLELLLAYYQNQLDQQLNQLGIDLVYRCAYYFPGVLQAIGRENWSLIQQLYQVLLKFPNENVKISLANSFHEIAKILGPELSKQNLISVLNELCQDKIQEVRNSIIKNLQKFISIFPMEDRDYLIDLLLACQKDQQRWRTRYIICTCIFPITRCFNQEVIFFQIAPILFKFCSDTVSIVRKKASKNVYHLLDTFNEECLERTAILDQIKAFSLSKRYNQRQSFCWMNYKLFYNEKFQELFYDCFLQMCQDQITCVRISALLVLDKFINKEGFSKERKFLKILLVEFIDDQNQEIQNIISKYTFVMQKTKQKILQNKIQRSKHGGSVGQLDDIPLFDEKIEQIRRSSSKV